MRISGPRSAAMATDAILSTNTERTLLTSGTRIEHARQRHDLREAERVGARPLTSRFAVLAARCREQRVRRLGADDEQVPRPEPAAHAAGDAGLRRCEQRLDVAAHGIQVPP